ncbi:MAG: hypothetical protein Q7S58_07230 [Candidatus Binatus sp.]|uniref:hypothetical protein n=1 Tax=Candidatus Binatus sp. TaxID=2811406 RepID=UPI0027284728|nr:hypothetical protein [Candidatus Binatus sp.]MDO8432189.1 hypothetical protein [Candidatus Binatus sp.]
MTCRAKRSRPADGKTLIAQPVLKPKRMWTIDDIRRCKYEVVSPLRAYKEKLRAGGASNGELKH